MKVIAYSTRSYEREFLVEEANKAGHEVTFLETRLSIETAALAEYHKAALIFANDDASAPVLSCLSRLGVEFLALRSAGFNHVDIEVAQSLNIGVARVPAYSPHSVAEHAVGLMLTLNRKFHRSYQRVREQNFSLEGLMGFDMFEKTVGVIGTGKIGEVVIKILSGFGCKVLALDPQENPKCKLLGATYVTPSELFSQSDIISLHCPLTPSTLHLIGPKELAAMKKGVMLINTSRGAVIDTVPLIQALKSGQIGSVGLDVYEEESDLFFKDLSQEIVHDDIFVRLMTFPNVLITAHQGFLTKEAVSTIARVTMENLSGFEVNQVAKENLVTASLIAR